MTTTLTYHKEWADILKEVLEKHYSQITVVPDGLNFVRLTIEYTHAYELVVWGITLQKHYEVIRGTKRILNHLS